MICSECAERCRAALIADGALVGVQIGISLTLDELAALALCVPWIA